MLTGGSQVSLFITVNIVFTFIALFGGIILFAVATDWFDVSVLYLFMGQCGDFFNDFSNCNKLYFSFFFCLNGEVIDILPWHGDDMLFLQMFHSGETCCGVTACSH